MGNLALLFRQMGVYAKLDLLWFLRDARYCLLYMVTDLITAVTSISGVLLLSARFGGFGGLDRDQLLFMLGYAAVIDGLYMFCYGGNNIGEISRVIGRGQLDHALVQPVPLWIQFISQGFMPVSGNSMLLFGVGLFAYACTRAGVIVTLPWILGLLLSLICSLVIMVSCVFAVSCIAFYAPSAAEEIAGEVRGMFSGLSSYPLGGLSTLWKTIFCTALPVGLAAWLPSIHLLGDLGGDLPPVAGSRAYLVGAAAVILITMLLLFRRGMKHYAKYGSPRYTSFGRQ